MPDNTALVVTGKKQKRVYNFKPGKSGNPAGRPLGSRNILKDEFLKLVVADVVKYGASALEELRRDNPEAYLGLVAGLLPKEVNAKIDHTVTHKSESVPETSAWVAGTLGRRADSEVKKPLPN